MLRLFNGTMRYPLSRTLPFVLGLFALLWSGTALALHVGGTTAEPLSYLSVNAFSEPEHLLPRGSEGETSPAIAGQLNTDRVLATCRRSDSTPSSGELRHSNLGTTFLPRGGATKNQSSNCLRSLGVWRSVCLQLSLQVLFCTWQA